MKREPSGAAERIARNPVTLRLRNTVPEATSYTNSRFVDIPIIRFPFAVVTRPARNPAGVGLAGVTGKPAGGVAGGEIGTGWVWPVAGSRRSKPAVPRITILPSFPTAMASGRDPTK